jgi:hypothetical protein
VVLSLLYNPVAVILHLVFRKSRPFHPALGLSLDLIVWGLSVPSIVLVIGGGMFWNWAPGVLNTNGVVDCSFNFNQFAPQCNPSAYTIGQLEIAGTIFLFFLL